MTAGAADSSEEPSSSAGGAGETMAEGSGLTLMRLGVWTTEVRLKMRLMSLMVEDCRSESRLEQSSSCSSSRADESYSSRCPIDSQGGALVSSIHSYTENGDPFARQFTDAVLEEVSPIARSYLEASSSSFAR